MRWEIADLASILKTYLNPPRICTLSTSYSRVRSSVEGRAIRVGSRCDYTHCHDGDSWACSVLAGILKFWFSVVFSERCGLVIVSPRRPVARNRLSVLSIIEVCSIAALVALVVVALASLALAATFVTTLCLVRIDGNRRCVHARVPTHIVGHHRCVAFGRHWYVYCRNRGGGLIYFKWPGAAFSSARIMDLTSWRLYRVVLNR